jgi:hypothetical protein
VSLEAGLVQQPTPAVGAGVQHDELVTAICA